MQVNAFSTALMHRHHQHHRLSSPTQQRSRNNDLQNGSSATIFVFRPMKDLPLALRRLSAIKAPAINIIRRGVVVIQQNEDQRISKLAAMAEKEAANKSQTKPQPLPGGIVANKEVRKELPPPPEKPEPGDCCGSGCVRCIWDIYYEELDAYNQLCKQYSSS
ncbi:hypothetical protein Dimus_017333 [Dionaea muscipula]